MRVIEKRVHHIITVICLGAEKSLQLNLFIILYQIVKIKRVKPITINNSIASATSRRMQHVMRF